MHSIASLWALISAAFFCNFMPGIPFYLASTDLPHRMARTAHGTAHVSKVPDQIPPIPWPQCEFIIREANSHLCKKILPREPTLMYTYKLSAVRQGVIFLPEHRFPGARLNRLKLTSERLILPLLCEHGRSKASGKIRERYARSVL